MPFKHNILVVYTTRGWKLYFFLTRKMASDKESEAKEALEKQPPKAEEGQDEDQDEGVHLKKELGLLEGVAIIRKQN